MKDKCVLNHGFSFSKDLWKNACAGGYDGDLKVLHRRRPILTAISIAFDWGMIFLSFLTVLMLGWMMIIPALLLIGNRQRALVVLIHDASHFLLHRTRSNDLIAQTFLCLPMFILLSRYRKLHNQHHKYLGDATLDTDYLHSEVLIATGWWKTFLSQALKLANLRTAALGMLPKLSGRERMAPLIWWGSMTSVLCFVFGIKATLLFIALWMAARLFVYHPIISFVIISDHVGLIPGTVLGFTRNHPSGLVSWLIHPHYNGWHLAHHVLPGLPFHALKKAHLILLRWPPYAQAEHCDSYFFGKTSVISSWCRKTPRWLQSSEIS